MKFIKGCMEGQMYEMDIKGIFNSGIYENYHFLKTANTGNEETPKTVHEADIFRGSRKSIMQAECYDYSEMFAAKIRKGAGIIEDNIPNLDVMQQEDVPSGNQLSGGSDEDGNSEAKVETEVKIINGQAYMTIKTTDEDGTVTIRKVKLGGVNSKGSVDRTFNPESLADAITL